MSRALRVTLTIAVIAGSLVSCSPYASVDRQYADVAELQELEVGSLSTLVNYLGDFRRIPASRNKGILETFATDSVEGGPYRALSEQEYVTVSLADSARAAQEAFASRCSFLSKGFRRADLKLDSGPTWDSCVSPVGQLRADPEGLYLPQDQYYSFVVVRKEVLLIEIWEIRRKSSFGSISRVVADLAHRLSPAATPRSGDSPPRPSGS